MLLYTSCDFEESNRSEDELETVMVVSDIDKMSKAEDEKLFLTLKRFSDKGEDWHYLLKDESVSILYESSTNDSYIKFEDYDERIYATMAINGPSMGKGTLVGIDADGTMVPFGQIDEVPVFPGCEGETDKRACFQKMIQKHISKNFRYPQKAQELGIQGRVNTMFVIEEDGSIQNIRMRGPDSLLENEVERIIRRLPKMTAGKQDGETVRVPFSIPISFRLEQSNLGISSSSANASMQYDMLLKERQRLLETSNEDNPIIKNLDDQLANLKTAIENNTEGNRKVAVNYQGAVPFAKVDQAPIFPGCENSADSKACFTERIQNHIRKHFNYPKEAQEKGLQGRVSVMFLISVDGAITSIAKRGPDQLLEDEAVRIISQLPRMIPGKHGGKNVAVSFSIPISFKLNDNSEIGPKVLNDIEVLSNGLRIKSKYGTNPLIYFVDGKETSKELISMISPDDIKSMNVLKGEVAQNIYGEKGKNGVIVIITKK